MANSPISSDTQLMTKIDALEAKLKASNNFNMAAGNLIVRLRNQVESNMLDVQETMYLTNMVFLYILSRADVNSIVQKANADLNTFLSVAA